MNQANLIKAMIEYYSGDAKRIQHFMKVYSFSKAIGELEKLDRKTQFILETAALLHDIGIKVSEEKYGSSSGKYQELEGPTPAKEMLTSLGFCSEVIDRVCFLVAHHHTYTHIDGLDYRILVEADFLVNLYEESASYDSILKAYNTVFKTNAGKAFCRTMFGLDIPYVSLK